MKRCNRCIFPETYPGIKFDQEGICNICQRTPDMVELTKAREGLKEKMDDLIIQKKDLSKYDCIVAYSGGKDSTYALIKLVKEYKLNCLAITIDNGFIAERAIENCKIITGALGVDFMTFAPAKEFMFNMYKSSVENEVHNKPALKRASAVCNSCIGLINTFMIKTALEKNIPIIAGGYIGGQVPKDAAILHLNLDFQLTSKKQLLEKYEAFFGQKASHYFELSEEEINRYKFEELIVINPLLAYSVTEEEIKEEIKEYGWKMPENTGANSSNCLLNDFGIYAHYKKYKYNPYIAEIAEQVRYGLMTKETAIKKAETIPSLKEVSHLSDKIGVEQSEL